MNDQEYNWEPLAERMVECQLRARDVTDKRVLEVMKSIPRHRFVSEQQREEAYYDCPLPIGYNQTISQPYIVGIMTELLEVRPEDCLLEIGGGSGYQAAVLGELAREVHTLEIIAPLANIARARLRELGYRNIHVHCADGTKGWPEAAPYDGILLAAAPEEIPVALFTQLRPGRRLVAPVGPLRNQELMVYEKTSGGRITRRRVFDVRFVPMIGAAAEDNSKTDTYPGEFEEL